jgi:hypothetical protein
MGEMVSGEMVSIGLARAEGLESILRGGNRPMGEMVSGEMVIIGLARAEALESILRGGNGPLPRAWT